MVALKHLKRSNMFRSIFQIIFRELVLFLVKVTDLKLTFYNINQWL
jgi:hypothetical protein